MLGVTSTDVSYKKFVYVGPAAEGSEGSEGVAAWLNRSDTWMLPMARKHREPEMMRKRHQEKLGREDASGTREALGGLGQHPAGIIEAASSTESAPGHPHPAAASSVRAGGGAARRGRPGISSASEMGPISLTG